MNVKTIQVSLAVVCAVVLLGCPGPGPEVDGGAGGGTGGGAVTGGGSGGGAMGGGTGGGLADAGMDAGTDAGVDAGNPCDAIAHDVRLGTYVLAAGAVVQQTATLPAGITQVAAIGDTVFGLSSDDTVKRLGTFPMLTAGTTVSSIRAPGDATATIFAGAFLAASGDKLLAGYTTTGVSANVALIETTDAGVSFINAPGNYDATGASSLGFLVNGIALGTATGAGAYALNASTQAGTAFATFDAAWLGSSFAAATTNGVALIGYYKGMPMQGNYVRGVAPSTYLGTVPFALAPEVLVASPDTTDDVMDLAAAGNDAFVAMGSFDMNFTARIRHVDRVPLTLSGSGVQTITVGTKVPLLSTSSTCSNVLFIQSNGPRLLVGIEDKNGRRLLDIQP